MDRTYNRTYTDMELLKESEGSYAAHFWNELTKDMKFTIHDKTLLNYLAEEHCPHVYFSSDDFNN